MPVKRRKSKARPDEVRAWAMFFQAGHDYFGELADAGVVEDDQLPTAELAKETWHRIGAEVLEQIEQMHRGFPPPARPFWAEEQFGPPKPRRRR